MATPAAYFASLSSGDKSMMVALAVNLNIPMTAFLPPFDPRFTTWTFDPIMRTLHVNGIKDFTNDFLSVPHEVIDALKGPPN